MDIADSGVQVYLIQMPGRMAMYGYNKLIKLNLLTDTTKKYILAGIRREQRWPLGSFTNIPI